MHILFKTHIHNSKHISVALTLLRYRQRYEDYQWLHMGHLVVAHV